MIDNALVAQLRALDEQGRAQAADTPTRFSMAGSCSRQIWFASKQEERTDLPDEASLWSRHMGTVLHDSVATLLAEALEDLEAEVPNILGELASGHADMLIEHAGVRSVVELKTMGAPAYDIAVGIWRGNQPRLKQGAGPKPEHFLQLALNIWASGADDGWLVYLCTDPVSRRVAATIGLEERARWCYAWHVDRTQVEPYVKHELDRMEHIVAATDPPPPMVIDSLEDVPIYRQIVDPGSGEWPCGWCGWRTRCLQEVELSQWKLKP